MPVTGPSAAPHTVRLAFAVELPYGVAAPGGDFLFCMLAACTPRQTVVHEDLDLGGLPHQITTDAADGTRLLRLRVPPGQFTLRYRASVDLRPCWRDPQTLTEVPVGRLPASVLPYLYPSRYCPSDRLHQLATREFGAMAPGYGRVQAICQWVRQRVAFRMNCSNSHTGAIETLVDGVGVCRDFAHLMIALCRAVNIPARFTTGIDYGADPALGPTDFHAYVEVFLGDGWWIIDPSGTAIPMGFVRLACGRDAADAAFATIFGPVTSFRPMLSITAIPGADGRLVLPEHRPLALSTADAPA